MARLTAEQYRSLVEQSASNKKVILPAGVLEKALGETSAPNDGNPPPKQGNAPKRGKMGNIKVPDPEGGQPFDSKAELRDWLMLRARVRAGEIMSVSRQPLFMLGGGVTYSPDFLIVHNDLSLEAWDTKGYATQVFINKRKQFEERYPQIKLTIHQTGKPRKKKK